MEAPVLLAQHVADDQTAIRRQVSGGLMQQRGLACGGQVVEYVEQRDMAMHRWQFGHVGMTQAHQRTESGALQGLLPGGYLARVVIHAEVGLGMAQRMQVQPEQADAAADVEQGQGRVRRQLVQLMVVPPPSVVPATSAAVAA